MLATPSHPTHSSIAPARPRYACCPPLPPYPLSSRSLFSLSPPHALSTVKSTLYPALGHLPPFSLATPNSTPSLPPQALPVATFYFYLLLYPLSFARFAFGYNRVWYESTPALGWLMRLTYPILPFVLIGHAAYTMLHKWAFPPAESTAASIWFSAPKGLLAPLLQQSSMDGESTHWVLLVCVACGGETARQRDSETAVLNIWTARRRERERERAESVAQPGCCRSEW